MPAIMAAKMCKAVSIFRRLETPKSFVIKFSLPGLYPVKAELKQLRNLRRNNPYIAGCLNQYIQSYYMI